MLRKKKSIAGAVIRNIFLILILLLLITYAVGVFYFHNHYFLHTQINSADWSLKTPAQLEEKNEEIAADYILSIGDREGNKFQVIGSDISYTYQSSGEEEQIMNEQNEYLWPLCLLSDYYYILHGTATFDQVRLEQVLDQMELFSPTYVTEPVNASVIMTTDGYEVIPEQLGNQLIQADAFAAITEAVSEQKSYLSLSDDLYTAPEITTESPQITELTAELDQYLNAEITYQVGENKEILDSSKIATFLTIEEDYTVSLNEKKITAYVDELASKYNTYGDERSFKTSMGDTITIGGGDYGWVIDKTKEKARLMENLEAGEPIEREPEWEQTAKQLGSDDIGNTYIEIDYTAQHMWYYVGGVLKLESDIVSGNISQKNGSVDGVYKIAYKQKNATLVGEGYSSAVSYFMPFAYNIGFHDASWRNQFGGTIYKTSGSHGCVNMPKDKAKELYELVEVGTPVVAYYREKVTLTNNAAKESNAYSYQSTTATKSN